MGDCSVAVKPPADTAFSLIVLIFGQKPAQIGSRLQDLLNRRTEVMMSKVRTGLVIEFYSVDHTTRLTIQRLPCIVD